MNLVRRKKKKKTSTKGEHLENFGITRIMNESSAVGGKVLLLKGVVLTARREGRRVRKTHPNKMSTT